MLLFLSPIIVYFNLRWFPNVDMTFQFLYTWGIAAQMFMIEVILMYSTTGYKQLAIKFFYYLPQFALGLYMTNKHTIEGWMFYTCAIFPYTQASNFCKLMFVAQR